MDQVKEQLTVAVEKIKEKQEDELVNNGSYGLLNNVHESMRVKPRAGAPTPDDLDELIARVWKEPSFFLAHPRAIAAFGRECTRRGVPPPTVTLFGTPMITWRGIPLVPSDKLHVSGKKIKDLCTLSGAKIQFRVNKTAEREGRPGLLELQGGSEILHLHPQAPCPNRQCRWWLPSGSFRQQPWRRP